MDPWNMVMAAPLVIALVYAVRCLRSMKGVTAPLSDDHKLEQSAYRRAVSYLLVPLLLVICLPHFGAWAVLGTLITTVYAALVALCITPTGTRFPRATALMWEEWKPGLERIRAARRTMAAALIGITTIIVLVGLLVGALTAPTSADSAGSNLNPATAPVDPTPAAASTQGAAPADTPTADPTPVVYGCKTPTMQDIPKSNQHTSGFQPGGVEICTARGSWQAWQGTPPSQVTAIKAGSDDKYDYYLLDNKTLIRVKK